ncbi:hypothetical protein EVAR_24223_1 [Eumeta japonica]|uniref:Uncharacterized protein n=1 Tax=Eumeta variegata TaxID=151549 RepID=A0A4C1W556_EUMVA|nr:hypothetical protein EVAR_24223_1 [Eumeta japonica]
MAAYEFGNEKVRRAARHRRPETMGARCPRTKPGRGARALICHLSAPIATPTPPGRSRPGQPPAAPPSRYWARRCDTSAARTAENVARAARCRKIAKRFLFKKQRNSDRCACAGRAVGQFTKNDGCTYFP